LARHLFLRASEDSPQRRRGRGEDSDCVRTTIGSALCPQCPLWWVFRADASVRDFPWHRLPPPV